MPTNLYGPGDNYHSMNSHVMPALIRKISEAKKNNISSVTCWGSGKPLREFLYVDDLAEACIFALNNWDLKDKHAPKDRFGKPLCLLNVGSDNEISISDLVKKISKAIGYKGEIIWDKDKPDGTPRKKIDTSRLKHLGWEASTDLDKGINLTIENYNKELESRRIRI